MYEKITKMSEGMIQKSSINLVTDFYTREKTCYQHRSSPSQLFVKILNLNNITKLM